MTILSQRDPRWGNINLGFSNTYIKDYGCTITCLAMIIGTTPDVVNQRLKDVQGFAYGNQVIWAKIPEAFPGIQINRVWSYNNDDVKNHIPNVLVEAPPNVIGGVSGKHWVVFVGDQQCNDPWTGSKRPTQDFLNYGPATGYCTVSGSWSGQTEETIPVKKTDFENLVAKSTKYDAFAQDNFPDVKSVHDAIDEKQREINVLNEQIIELNKTIDELRKQNTPQTPQTPSVGSSTPPQHIPKPSVKQPSLLDLLKKLFRN